MQSLRYEKHFVLDSLNSSPLLSERIFNSPGFSEVLFGIYRTRTLVLICTLCLHMLTFNTFRYLLHGLNLS